MEQVIEVECKACGKKGENNVLTLDVSTKWECVYCGKKNYYKSAAEVRHINVSDSFEAGDKVG